MSFIFVNSFMFVHNVTQINFKIQMTAYTNLYNFFLQNMQAELYVLKKNLYNNI